MTLEQYRAYIDSLSFGSPEWLAIIDWQHTQLDLVKQDKRIPPSPTEKLVDVYFEEVINNPALEG